MIKTSLVLLQKSSGDFRKMWKRVPGLRTTFGESLEIFVKCLSLVCLYNKQYNTWVRVDMESFLFECSTWYHVEHYVLSMYNRVWDIMNSLLTWTGPQYRGVRIRSGQAVHRWQEIFKCCRNVFSMHQNKVADCRKTKACFKREEDGLQNLHYLVNLSN